MSSSRFRHQVTPDDEGLRLDQFCARRHPEHSRSRLAALIRERLVTLDGEPSRPGDRVVTGQWISLEIPPARDDSVQPQDMPLRVLHEDADLLVIDKPAGLVVHPGAGVRDGTLASALLFRDPGVGGIGGAGRCGIVHRLDRGTTGLMVVARTEQAHVELSRQFREREVEKDYDAVVWGRPKNAEGEIELPVGRDSRRRERMSTRAPRGRHAHSRYRVLAEIPGFAFVRIRILTGRTHQVRVHMSSLGHPLVGDLVYGGNRARSLLDRERRRRVESFDRPALHARRLVFSHPGTRKPMTFVLNCPDDMVELWSGLGGVVP